MGRSAVRGALLFCGVAAIGCGGSPNGGADGGGGVDLAGPQADIAMAPDGGCMALMKSCSGGCVAADPAHGCNLADCTPCATGMNGAAGCAAGACSFACNVGFGDCDGNATNGCEKDVLADPGNCGSCGFSCANGATCTGGACQLVAPMPMAVGDLAGVAVDAVNLYWTTAKNPGDVWSIPKAGGNPSSIAKMQLQPRAVAVDATDVYWTNSVGNSVMKCAIGGCNNQPTPVAMGQMRPVAIVTDGKNVYWNNQNDGRVMQAPASGGMPVAIAMTAAMGPRGIAVDAQFVYFTHNNGSVNRVPIGGGSVVVLANGQNHPWGIAVDATHAYYTNQGMGMNTGSIAKVPIGLGTVVPRAAMQNFPLSIAIDATTIYWLNEGGGAIQKVAK